MSVPRIGFMFAGQGAQKVGMGLDLVDVSKAARDVFETADRTLGRALSEICFHGPADELTASFNCQPAVYTMAVACAEVLRERFSVTPAVCGGLSLGEFAALTIAGSLSFEQGLGLVARRGELMDEACRRTDGVMAAVLNTDPEIIEEVCRERGVDVANYNCPGQIVISGTEPGVAACVDVLRTTEGAKTIMLRVAGAYHSRLMKPAAEKFSPVLDRAEIAAPSCPVAQNVSGRLVTEPDQIRENLKKQVTGSVKWEECVRSMIETEIDMLIEIGPGRVLSGFMRRIDRGFKVFNMQGTEDLSELESVLGRKQAVCPTECSLDGSDLVV